jgi:hypothetical protein
MTQAALVLIHVRFAPDGAVTNISEQPTALSPLEWFNTLSLHAGGSYQALAGGRGVFRLTRDDVVRFQQ